MKRLIFPILFLLLLAAATGTNGRNPEPLRVSRTNPHLLETVKGKPVFLNNYTLWFLLRNSKREDIPDLIDFCKANKYNMISVMILDFDERPENAGRSAYGANAFERGPGGLPDPLKPVLTAGNDPSKTGEYDFWDHLDYIIEMTEKNGMYIGLHPAWGDWFSGQYNGERPGDPVIFNTENAYKYGQWLGKRYKEKRNIIWMVGGDRSAVYDSKTIKGMTQSRDYRPQYRALAEGLADGVNGENNQDGQANYNNILISYHPRKWAPNSSEWFHDDPWLTFNSIQDTPADQVSSLPHDYNLKPVKPVWLYEGRYESRIDAWGVRYQAYQTVLSGGFGHTYGGEKMYPFPPDWREMIRLPGSLQMKYLYVIAREIWTDRQFFSRTPDQSIIIGDQGTTTGDGISNGEGDGKGNRNNALSDRISAMRGSNGKWAIIYSANGRDVNLDMSHLYPGKMNAYLFNPRNGRWWSGDIESEKMFPAIKNLKTGEGIYLFDPPGTPGIDNDWILILK